MHAPDFSERVADTLSEGIILTCEAGYDLVHDLVKRPKDMEALATHAVGISLLGIYALYRGSVLAAEGATIMLAEGVATLDQHANHFSDLASELDASSRPLAAEAARLALSATNFSGDLMGRLLKW